MAAKKAPMAVVKLADRPDIKNPKNKPAVRVIRNPPHNKLLPRGALVETYKVLQEYTIERGEAIAKELGSRSLAKICADSEFLASIGLPGLCEKTIVRWSRRYPEFGKIYHEAWTTRLELEAHELVEIADDDSSDMYAGVDKAGKKYDMPNPVAVNRSTLRINTRMSLLKLMHPKFKDKPSVNVNVGHVNALNLTPEQIRDTLNMAAEEMNRLALGAGTVIEGEAAS